MQIIIQCSGKDRDTQSLMSQGSHRTWQGVLQTLGISSSVHHREVDVCVPTQVLTGQKEGSRERGENRAIDRRPRRLFSERLLLLYWGRLPQRRGDVMHPLSIKSILGRHTGDNILPAHRHLGATNTASILLLSSK